jgi:hypothetical protein
MLIKLHMQLMPQAPSTLHNQQGQGCFWTGQAVQLYLPGWQCPGSSQPAAYAVRAHAVGYVMLPIHPELAVKDTATGH